MDFDFDPVGNFGYGTVLTAPSPSTSGVTVELNAGEGALFPDPSPTPYNVTAYPDATGPLLSNAEIWRVTAKVGDVLTIIRAQEGTSAKAVQFGWQVASAPTAKFAQDVYDAINAPSGVTPGSYTSADITVDAQGRVTAAANGTPPTSGTVTSVGLAMPSIFSVSGSPVTSAGTLTAELATQAANLVFAGPATGSPNTPTFRSLVAADIPDLSLVYQPLNAKLTAIAALANASGWLKNNGSGTFSYSTPTKSDVGLGNADNTSDANKPVSTATQTALNLKADLTLLGAVSGIATLGVDQKLTASQLPSIAITEFLGSVASQAAMLALVGQLGDWCIRTDSGLTYVITGPDPTQLSDWTSLSYPTAPVLSVAGRTGVVVLTSADVGLGNVDNTADSAKSFTTAQITSGTFAAARMPAFTGDATSTAGTVALTVVKINGVSLAGLATGILKNTTATGAPSIAVAADFPTLNQNTTGSAATLTTARAIYGNNFDGSAALTQIIASTFGGTGNGFTKFTGPATAEKTFTLPNSSETLLYAGGALGTPSGGTVTNLTGTASININGTVGAGTPNTGAFTTISASGLITKTNTAAADSNFFASGTSTTGANYLTITNTQGAYQIGTENSTGGAFGFAAYEMFHRAPAGAAFGFSIAGTGIVGRITATGFQGVIGSTTPAAGSFTTLVASVSAAEAATIGSATKRLFFRADSNGVSVLTGAVQTGTGLYIHEANATIAVVISSGFSGPIFTSTGLNNCAIGATTPSTGAFTTLNASGNVVVGTTIPSPPSSGTADGVTMIAGGQLLVSGNGGQAAFFRRRSSDGSIVSFYRDTTEVGSVSVTTTATAYNTSSDRRLKTNIRNFKSSGPIIDAMRPVIHDWKSGEKNSVGFIAQELHAIFPQAVTKGDNGSKMKTAWGIDYSKPMPIVIAELQSLRKRVAELEKLALAL